MECQTHKTARSTCRYSTCFPLDSPGRCSACVIDRMCKCGELTTRARDLQETRNCRSNSSGRKQGSHHSTTPYGECAAFDSKRSSGTSAEHRVNQTPRFCQPAE